MYRYAQAKLLQFGRFIGLFHGVDVRKCLPGLNSKKIVEARDVEIPMGFSHRDVVEKVEDKGAKNGNGSLKVFEDVNKT